MDNDLERSAADDSSSGASDIGDRSDDLLDPSAGAQGQDPDKGAVEEAMEDTGAHQKPAPG